MSSISQAGPGPGQGNVPDWQEAAHRDGRFSSDPGWDEAWWWFWLPCVTAAALIVIHVVSPRFYQQWILPEGYGFLELGHFFIPFAACLIALKLLLRPFVRRQRLLAAFVALAATACLYIAGEEMSWGQHLFNWSTPEYWTEINRQQETNVHNISPWFNQRPRLVLELGVLAGGLVFPLLALAVPKLRRNRWAIYLPAAALVPTAACLLLFKVFALTEKIYAIRMPINRPAEATETFLYLFLLYYMVVMARRIGELAKRAPR